MGFFDLFTSRNPDILSKDEKEAAEILKNILQSHQTGDNTFGSEEVTQLAVGLYYLASRRTGKKIVRVEEFVNIDAIFSGNTKGLQYAGVFEAIKQTIENACNNTSSLNSVVTLQDCEKAILVTLKTAAKKISEI